MPSQWLAVEAGTDLRARARQIQSSWDRLVGEGALGAEFPPQSTAGVRPTIVDSWRRVLATGLDPTVMPSIEADRSETQERWLEHPLGALRHVLVDQLQMWAQESNSLVQVTDPSGLTLYLGGPEWLKARAAEMNLVEGARCSETDNGTNGVGTALAVNHPVQVFAFEHFSQAHREWVCSGAPIHDLVSGRLVGVLNLSSPWKIAHPRSLELVTNAARTTEQRLLDSRRDLDARLRSRYGDLTTTSTDLLVNREGYVVVGERSAHPKPLDVPAGGGEIALDDGSLAVAEPLGQGEAYLVRRSARRRARAAPGEALERAEKRARELATEQAALRQVATLVAYESSVDRLVAVVAEQVARVFGVPLVRLVRYEPDAAVVVGGFSESDDTQFPIGGRSQLDTPGLLATIRHTGRAARSEDYGRTPGDSAGVVRAAGMRSAVGTPIVVDGRVWGAIVLLSRRRASLPEDTEARLADFTDLVATAIANSESRAALGELADEQAALRRVATLVAQGARPAEVFDAVAEEVGRLLGVASTGLLRFEPDQTVTLVAGWGRFREVVPVGKRLPLGGTNVASEIARTGRSARYDESVRATGALGEHARNLNVRSSAGGPIVVAGRLWGAMTVAAAEGRPLPPDVEPRLVEFTELIATTVSNAAMRAELAASRARVIAAADESRRRIERDLHDGAQQQLVTLAVAFQRAQAKIPRELDEVRADFDRVADGLAAALDELRDFSRGIHPAILTEGGISPALKALGRRSDVRVKLDVGFEHRLPDAVEVAAYYTVSEALTNASKHASAARVWVSLRVDGDLLLLSIRDDGVGGADPSRGSGLTGLRDRIEALGGTIKIESPPGGGTLIEVEIPIAGPVDQNLEPDEMPAQAAAPGPSG